MITIRTAVFLLLAIALAPTRLCAAGGPAELEKEGKERLAADLARASELGRPDWLKETPLEVKPTTDLRQMRSAVDTRLRKGKAREALRIVYALIDEGSGKPKAWAQLYLPLALVRAREFSFAIVEYTKLKPTAYTLLDLGRCYLEYYQFEEAAGTFGQAIEQAKSSRQRNVLTARGHWGLGDVHRKKCEFAEAKAEYERARQAYELESEVEGKPGWYVDKMKTETNRMRFLADLCDAGALDVSELKSGTYTGQAQGYEGLIAVRVTIAGGKIMNVEVVSERESIPLYAFTETPRRVVEKQTPSVDAVTGATVTSVGVMGAVLRALQQAK